MVGRRRPDDTKPAELEPGDFSKVTTMLGICWWFCTPNGFHGAMGSAHHVEDCEDGMITVEPNPPADPGNSNSIKVIDGHGGEWHGYIYDGVWESV